LIHLGLRHSFGNDYRRIAVKGRLAAITLHTEKEEALSLQRQLDVLGVDLVQALEQLQAPAALVDRTGQVVWQNRASVDLVGDKRGWRFAAVAPDYRQQSRAVHARMAMGADEVAHTPTVIVDTEGNRRRVELVRLSLRNEDDFLGVLTISRLVSTDNDTQVQRLTPRQHETLGLLAAGRSTEQIAGELGVTRETARNYIRLLLRSLGAHSRVEAVARGRALGLV
jgi:DNA-binding CsgD family transcriptional regulator